MAEGAVSWPVWLAVRPVGQGVGSTDDRYGLVDWAILVFLVAAAAHALIPVLLQYFGSDWKTVRVDRGERIPEVV